jgi:glycosyltransferase involved in cell wall biosynthesis
MENPKVSILSKFVNGPWGGGNQFLKALATHLHNKGVYTPNPLEADIVIVNSKDELQYVESLKKDHNKTIIHRVDGVFSIYRGPEWLHLDQQVYYFLKNFADGVVYQSNWSKVRHRDNGSPKHPCESVIYNAPDSSIFNTTNKPSRNPDAKTRLITTSWSPNMRKGFSTMQFLDENLDFDRYEYIFVGQSPVKFKNIEMIDAVPSEKLAEIIKTCDIFITASENDTCSNSLIESMSCGLPAVGLNSGGTPEIIKEGGKTFAGCDDILQVIDGVSENLQSYIDKISIETFSDIGKRYYNFMRKVHGEK